MNRNKILITCCLLTTSLSVSLSLQAQDRLFSSANRGGQVIDGQNPSLSKDTLWIHPRLNVKTNLLYDFLMVVPQYGWAPVPNLSLEYFPNRGHLTPVLEVDWSDWRSDLRNKTWIVFNVLLEGRYYIRGVDTSKSKGRGVQNPNNYTGHYFAAYANMGTYDIQFSKTKGWLSDKWGKTFGFGIGWGYVKRFPCHYSQFTKTIQPSRWKWEVNAALGYLHSGYDGYHGAEPWADKDNFYFDWHENPADYHRYRNHLNYWGLTRVGFSISYDLF